MTAGITAETIAQAQAHHDAIGALLQDWMWCHDDPENYLHNEGIRYPRGGRDAVAEDELDVIANDLRSRVGRLAVLLGVPGVQP